MSRSELDNVWVPRTWAVVLAGGDGRRLLPLTTPVGGMPVPKQFCSLRGGSSLLADALSRAGAVAPLIQTCAVVAAQHRWWWTSLAASRAALAQDNVLVQPLNKGTAYGVLLGLLHLEARDPGAAVVMLPADHYVRREDVLRRALRRAAELAARGGGGAAADPVILLGAEPDRPATDVGYIVPEAVTSQRAVAVKAFVEKPDTRRARRLLRAGALWNMFIVAGSVRALLSLYDRRHAASVALLRGAIARRTPRCFDTEALRTIYRQLETLDFSRDLLEPQAERLRVLGVPPCGWNDLGTPQSVFATLHDLPASRGPACGDAAGGGLHNAALSMLDQLERPSRIQS